MKKVAICFGTLKILLEVQVSDFWKFADVFPYRCRLELANFVCVFLLFEKI